MNAAMPGHAGAVMHAAERKTALFLASGAADATELREWLQMAGIIPSGPPGLAIPAEKRCPRCEDVKAASEWHRDAASPDGLASCCKACRSAYVGSEERLEKRREGYSPEQRRERYLATPRNSPQVNVALSPELHAPLAEEAAARGISMSAVIRDMLAERYEARLRRAS